VAEFEGRLSAEVRRQEKLDMVEVWKKVFEEVGEKLAKIEVSFFREKTLKGDNIRIKDSGLCFIFFFFIFYLELRVRVIMWCHTWLSQLSHISHIITYHTKECRRF